MQPRFVAVFLALLGGLILAGAAAAEPEKADLNGFLDLGNLLEPSPQVFQGRAGMVALRQDDGWGWGEDEPGGDEGGGGGGDGGWGWGEEEPKPEPPAEPPATPPAEPPAEPPTEPPANPPSGGGGETWGEGGWEEEPAKPVPGPDTAPPDREEEYGPTDIGVNQARKTRIGIELGGFMPMGEKEQGYAAGGMFGAFFGFGLPPFLGGLTVTSEIRLLGGMTSSDQTDITDGTGYEVSTTLFLIKDDYLIHFFPRSRGFNLWWFVGLCVGIEMSEATDVAGKAVSETFPGFLIDTGFGAWVNLGGPVDLLFKLEFNLVPMSKNVPFFTVGEMGLQVRF